jgi:hypothetical protein
MNACTDVRSADCVTSVLVSIAMDVGAIHHRMAILYGGWRHVDYYCYAPALVSGHWLNIRRKICRRFFPIFALIFPEYDSNLWDL